MEMMRRLFVPGYYSGFSNNKMSLDIAVVLAHLTGRVLVPYRFRMPRRRPIDVQSSSGVPEPIVVPDLFEIPVPWSDEYLLKTWISLPGALECAWRPAFDSVLSFPPTASYDGEHFQNFRNGRGSTYTFDERSDEVADLHLNTLTLAHYSHFFFLDQAHRREVIDLMKQVRPKQPYQEAADRIVASLGTFNAIHLRRGDFLSNELSKRGIIRSSSISGQEIVGNLASRLRRDEPLLVCTDGSPGEEIFGPIRNYFREVIFLDGYLGGNAATRAIVSELPKDNEAVSALLTQLIASRARNFVGTLFSTFTALIHRMRGLAGYDSTFLFCYNDFLSPLVRFKGCEFLPVDDGPYSWNRVRYPVSPDAYSWFREWPESFEAADPTSGDGAPSLGVLDLPAGAALVHGKEIRLMEDAGGRKVIGNWTDQCDFVSWEISLAAAGEYSVEIRYGCPDQSSGSRYIIELGGTDGIEGRVWNTGGWASFSPWLPLGRLRIAAGWSTLIVRVIEKRVPAAMNLNGIRLIPVESSRT
jgi:GDP-fucose protein O-fucosyltransferase